MKNDDIFGGDVFEDSEDSYINPTPTPPMKRKPQTLKTVEKDYWECPRCGDSIGERTNNIPCPRGGCEANCVGTIIVTSELIKKKL